MADIVVCRPVSLGHAEAGEVEAAAIIEIELLVLIDYRPRIDRRAEIQPALRHPADDPRLSRQCEIPSSFFSAATAATPSGIPIPRLTMPPSGNSKAHRRAITLRSSRGEPVGCGRPGRASRRRAWL